MSQRWVVPADSSGIRLKLERDLGCRLICADGFLFDRADRNEDDPFTETRKRASWKAMDCGRPASGLVALPTAVALPSSKYRCALDSEDETYKPGAD